MNGWLRNTVIIGVSVLLQGSNLYAHENGSGAAGGNSGDQIMRSAVASFIEWFERYAIPRTRQTSGETEITSNPSQRKSPDNTRYGIGYEIRMKSGAGSGDGPGGGSRSGAGDGC